MVERGFTLIECVVVCGLFLLVATLTWSSFSWLHHTETQTHVDALHAACMYMQQVAQAQHKHVSILLNSNNHTYSVEGRVVALPSHIRFGVRSDVKGPPSSAHHVITNAITFPNETITFTPYGIIQPGTIYIRDTQTQELYALSVSVAQVSYIRKYRYEGKWRLLA